MKIKFGKMFMQDLEHKLGVVCDTLELQEDYGLTLDECEAFRDYLSSCNARKIREIEIPSRMIECVKGEMQNMADIAWGNAKGEGISAIGWATSIESQLNKLNQMKTSQLNQLSKEITQGDWILKNCQRTGMALIEGPKGEDIAIADEGFPQHNAHAISLTPQLIREVLELREALADCIESLSRLESQDGAYRVSVLNQARSLLARHETNNQERI